MIGKRGGIVGVEFCGERNPSNARSHHFSKLASPDLSPLIPARCSKKHEGIQNNRSRWCIEEIVGAMRHVPRRWLGQERIFFGK